MALHRESYANFIMSTTWSLLTTSFHQIEGCFTIAAGLYFAVIFPKSPEHPVSLFRIRWFNERDSHIMTQRVLVDDPAKVQGRLHVSWHEIKRTVSRTFQGLGAENPYRIWE